MNSYEKVHNEETKHEIISFEMEDYFDERFITQTEIPSIGTVKISVYDNEGDIPHFHIERKNKLDCCVCIYEPLYFDHGRHVDQLNSRQRKQLDAVLRENANVENYKGTNWEYIAYLWEKYSKNNTRHYISKEQPDYTKMVNTKRGGL